MTRVPQDLQFGPASLVAAAAALALAGCAGFEHAKGQVQLRTGQTDEGIASLENATRLAPTDPAYKIDYLQRRDENAQTVLAQADILRADGKLVEARAAYEHALKLDRGNARAAMALAALPRDARFEKLLADGEGFLGAGRFELALDRAAQVLQERPRNKRAIKLREAVLDAQAKSASDKAGAAIAPTLLEKPVTLQFNDAPLKFVFESLSRSTGLNVLLDRDVKPASKVTIFVSNIAVGDAIDFILMQNQLEKRLINSNTMVVYPSTDAKKAEYEDLSIRSFQVTNADMKYLATMLRSMIKPRELTADERSGVLVIRDTPEKLRLAAKLIALHDVADPEIMLEVEILEVTTARRSDLGLDLPDRFTVTTPGTQAALTLGALKNLRSNDLLASPLSATLNFKLQDTDTRLLASPRIRARNKEKAKIMIGDRVPTITNTVTPVVTGSAVVTGSVSYQDVGLKLEFEPQVYADNEVGIKIALEVSNIAAEFTDAQGGRSYQIGTRNATTNLRLKDGETQILGGLISDEDRNTASKIPGLGHLPVVGRIFGNNDGSASRSEIVLAITPRIVRNLPSQAPEARSIFTGTANVLREKPILAEPINQGRGVVSVGGGAVPTSPAAAGGSFAAPPALPVQSTLPTGGALLPAPPPMYVRPAPAVK